MSSVKSILRPYLQAVLSQSPVDRTTLWWNSLRARSFQPRPIFRDVPPFTEVPAEIAELLFALPASQGNFERGGVAGHDRDDVVKAAISHGFAIAVAPLSTKDNSPWALRADVNDAFSKGSLTQRSGIRFNQPDFEVHREMSDRLISAVAKAGIFYIHRPVDERFVSRAELLQARAIEVDVWRRNHTKTSLHSSSYWNATCRDIEIEEPARFPVNFRSRLPYTFHEFTQSGSEFVQFPIDMVYLWVDGADEKWLAIKEQFVDGGEGINHASKAQYRFREFDELKHSIRSVEAFAPWVRNIYIVTAGQKPKWLNELSDKIRIVDHSEIIPAEWLPTYSSHVIAAHLHHIDGIAEHFFYMNDDFFFAGQSTPERWFHPNGTALGHMARNRILAVTAPGSTVVKLARRSTIGAIREHGFEASTKNLGHGPMPWRRSILVDAWKEFNAELTATGARRFRHADDMIPDWLVALYGQATGALMRMHYLRGKYVAMNKRAAIIWLKFLLRRSHEMDFYCLNDGDTKNTRKFVSEQYQPHRYRVIFRHLLAYPSRYEKDGAQ